MLSNDLLIDRALVGFSGGNSSDIMRKAMNRCSSSVIAGGFGSRRHGVTGDEEVGEHREIIGAEKPLRR
ncbi:hypothetical protein ACNKHR_26695 [Shigella flexneri]